MNILLLEDEVLLADLLAKEISSIPGVQILNVAHTVKSGMESIDRYEHDLCILDLLMPDGNGIEVAEHVLARSQHPRIVVLTGQSGHLVCSRQLHESIIAVVEKTEVVDTLLKIIHIEVDRLSKSSTAQRNQLAGEGEGSRAAKRRECTKLTDRESEIFRLIGEGMSMTAIADRLSISVLTARTHRRNIISKLGISGSKLVVHAAEEARRAVQQPG